MSPSLEAIALQILAIVWINVVLSGDNAVVIALACRDLPAERRRLAVIVGSVVAVLMRVAFTLVVVELLALPYLKLACGALLLFIAVRLVKTEAGGHDVAAAPSIWSAVRTIVVADVVMSLDNVVAIAAAANGSWLLIIFGLALSVPLIMFGSTLMLKLLTRLPVLAWVGAALLGYVAGELAGSDPTIEPWIVARVPHWVPAAAGAAFVVLVAPVWNAIERRRRRRPAMLDAIDL